jgi:MFS family permease
MKKLSHYFEDFRFLNIFANVYFAIFEFALGLYVLYLGGNSLDVGLAYATYNFSWIVFMPFSGILKNSSDVKRSLLTGFILLFFGLFSFSFFGMPLIYTSIFLIGFSSSIISASMLYLVSFFGGYRDANAYAQLMYFGIVGSGLGAFIGFLFFLYSQFTGKYLFSLRITFFIYSLLALLAILFTINIKLGSAGVEIISVK